MRLHFSLVAAGALLLSGTSFAAQAAPAVGLQDTVIANGLRVEKFIPLAELKNHPEVRVVMPDAVDPLAIYSNVTTFQGTGINNGAALGGISRLVMDDLTFTTDPAVSNVTTIRFAVANFNATPQSVRARIRFWLADGAPLGAGLPNAPGTYYNDGVGNIGYSFNAFTFAAGVTTLSGTLGTGFAVPAGVTTTLWAGITFDNVGTTTGATDVELSLFGEGLFAPVDLGSSTNTLWETTAAGSFFPTSNPAGAAITTGASTANVGWEFVVTTLPVELSGFTVE